VPRGTTQDLAMVMHCQTHPGALQGGQKDLRIVGLVKAYVPLNGHQDAQLWALPKPAILCLRF
jgi:hypothetical protein